MTWEAIDRMHEEYNKEQLGVKSSPMRLWAYNHGVLYNSTPELIMEYAKKHMTHEELAQFFAEAVLWGRLMYWRWTHIDSRDYNIDWRLDKGSPGMTTLKMCINDVLGREPEELFDEKVYKEALKKIHKFRREHEKDE